MTHAYLARQKDARARNTYSSTAIEGNPLSLEQVRELEEGRPLAAVAQRSQREVMEAISVSKQAATKLMKRPARGATGAERRVPKSGALHSGLIVPIASENRNKLNQLILCILREVWKSSLPSKAKLVVSDR